MRWGFLFAVDDKEMLLLVFNFQISKWKQWMLFDVVSLPLFLRDPVCPT